mgnify:CR=1 FL=1
MSSSPSPGRLCRRRICGGVCKQEFFSLIVRIDFNYCFQQNENVAQLLEQAIIEVSQADKRVVANRNYSEAGN